METWNVGPSLWMYLEKQKSWKSKTEWNGFSESWPAWKALASLHESFGGVVFFLYRREVMTQLSWHSCSFKNETRVHFGFWGSGFGSCHCKSKHCDLAAILLKKNPPLGWISTKATCDVISLYLAMSFFNFLPTDFRELQDCLHCRQANHGLLKTILD